MKLRSIRVKNLKGIKDLEVNLVDPVKKKVRDRTIIVGKNGSGKTTLLETAYSTLCLMGVGEAGLKDVDVDFLYSSASTFISADFHSNDDVTRTFNIVAAGNLRLPDKDTLSTPDYFITIETEVDYEEKTVEYVPRISLYNKEAEALSFAIRTAIAGIDDNPIIGNLIFFPTDRLAYFPTHSRLVNEKPEYEWAYQNNRHHDQWEGSLESFLTWLYFRDLKLREGNRNEPSLFDEFKQLVNRFLEGKQITSVGMNYRVEVVKEGTGEKISLDVLSSGEKQLILLIGEMFRRIRKGSLILIDEPEIHLHPVWQKLFVDTLTKMCKKYEAQFIMTTQSPFIADAVLESEIVRLDDLIEESRA
ncbi:AAA family ATPase [Tumebacillus permanentifrigoris]|uniref:Putative ATP-binding protein involved in virulence n=1 Tax=Tumebacillus permanentifrigoris TaxID=378543 RepID=A0A316E0E8_9BACL|nr:AAA family ATPase [Tumebacillus permanentifrigoris]PWK16280.1 putative ATP-binding protein involved in virulence [Tumebacillus permanentifrigoris]